MIFELLLSCKFGAMFLHLNNKILLSFLNEFNLETSSLTDSAALKELANKIIERRDNYNPAS